MSRRIDIVDRLTLAIEEVSRERARLHEYTGENLPQLLVDARDELHRLQGLVYAYPPDPISNHAGVTWREEYENNMENLKRLHPDDFKLWQAMMTD